MGGVVGIWSKLLNKTEPAVTMELDNVIFSKKHGHAICVMRLVGKNIFPKMTTAEILASPDVISGISPKDLITITKLDSEIKAKRNALRLVEVDRNGTVVVENGFGRRRVYSERLMSKDTSLLNQLNGRDAYGIGYRLGVKEGSKLSQQKQKIKMTLLSLFKWK